MQTGVERETFLLDRTIEAGGPCGIEDHIPAMGGNRAGKYNEGVPLDQPIAEGSLSSARCAWPQPIRVRNIGRPHDMNSPDVQDMSGRQNVRDGVEKAEGLMNCDLENRSRRVESAVDDAVPA